MSLFNSLKSQHERLMRSMDDQKTLPLASAAAVMRIRREKVDEALSRMHKKGMFGSDQPYVDDTLGLVIRDKRYAPLASLLHAAGELTRKVDEALQNLKRVRRVSSQQLNSERVRAVGNFVRDVVDSAMKKGDPSAVLRDRTGTLMRDLIAPEVIPDGTDGLRPMAQTLSLMASCAAGLKDFALMHPDMHYDNELSAYVLSACHQIEAWNGCGIQAGSYSPETDPAVQAIERRLGNEIAPGLTRRLDELHAAAARGRSVPQHYDDPMLQEVAQKCADIRVLSRQPQSAAVRNAMARVNAILDDILSQLHAVPESREQAGVRSLRVCYLPMLEELLEKYIRYEARAQSTDTLRVMMDTENALAIDLPRALQKLLQDLRTEDAIDLEAQTVALRQKMQLDGLLSNNDSQS
ncbi:MAG: hypothetical protein IJA59_05435 [Clostridia bacterium]|nr:hypothetical protein [Clostridia bacterium]